LRRYTVVDKLLRGLDDVQLRLLRLDERGRLLQNAKPLIINSKP
jgi:hypothetical protein